MTVAALVVGAGRGERLQRSLSDLPEPAPRDAQVAGVPKAFVRLAGRTLLAHSLDALAGAPEIARLVPVLPPDALNAWDGVKAELAPATAERCLDPVAGGTERQDSVLRGLAVLGPETTHVAVHDAARPFVSPAAVSRVVRAALEHGAALLAVPVSDTIHLALGERIGETPERATCRAAQTPQVFRVDWLRKALEEARVEGRVGTDDAGLVAACPELRRQGAHVQIVAGEEANRKITDAGDLAWAEARLAAAEAAR
ncbi:MAG: IspD/TarI family cytidylyltransferase [Myxococcota bacterium]|nr:IspD/TarI family cytidylyltransferase [Myxococcota bacterium]